MYIYGVDIKVPTKPYLKRYLHRKYPMPYKPREDEPFGAYLAQLLRDDRDHHRYAVYLKKFTVKYHIRVNKRQFFNQYMFRLTPYSIYRFNSFVEKMFMQELYNYLAQVEETYASTKHMFTIFNSPFTTKAAIYRFLNKYNIDQSELSYQTVKKSYYRYKQKNKKKLLRILSPKLTAPQPTFDKRLTA